MKSRRNSQAGSRPPRKRWSLRFGTKSLLAFMAFTAILVVFWNSTARFWFPDTETQINRIILSGGFVGTIDLDPTSGETKQERYPAGSDYVCLTGENFANREVNTRLFPAATSLALTYVSAADRPFVRLRRLRKLTKLALFECDASGMDVRQLSHNALTTITVHDCPITDKEISELLNFTNLQSLTLHYWKVPSQITTINLQQLSKLTALTDLTMVVSPDASPTLQADVRKLLPNCLVDITIQDRVPTDD